jgi:hypothetical protein
MRTPLAWAKLLVVGRSKDWTMIVRLKQHRQRDTDVAAIRDRDALSKLPFVRQSSYPPPSPRPLRNTGTAARSTHKGLLVSDSTPNVSTTARLPASSPQGPRVPATSASRIVDELFARIESQTRQANSQWPNPKCFKIPIAGKNDGFLLPSQGREHDRKSGTGRAPRADELALSTNKINQA